MEKKLPKIDISIDKICLVGDILKNSPFTYKEFYLIFREYIEKKYITPLNISNSKYNESYITIDGAFIQYGIDSLRVEFNPNLITEETKLILKRILNFSTNIHLTRLDVACDLYNYDILNYNIINISPIKKAYYYDRVGKIETIYFGSQKSNKFFRIYDKAKEQKQDGIDWWRVELQLRDIYIDKFLNNYSDFFQDILIFRYDFLDRADLDTRAMLNYLLNDFKRFGELSKNTRSRYRNIIKTLNFDSLDFINDLVENSKNCLKETIFEYIS